MKNKTKKILAGACLGLVGMGCLTGCTDMGFSEEQVGQIDTLIDKGNTFVDESLEIMEDMNASNSSFQEDLLEELKKQDNSQFQEDLLEELKKHDDAEFKEELLEELKKLDNTQFQQDLLDELQKQDNTQIQEELLDELKKQNSKVDRKEAEMLVRYATDKLLNNSNNIWSNVKIEGTYFDYTEGEDDFSLNSFKDSEGRFILYYEEENEVCLAYWATDLLANIREINLPNGEGKALLASMPSCAEFIRGNLYDFLGMYVGIYYLEDIVVSAKINEDGNYEINTMFNTDYMDVESHVVCLANLIIDPNGNLLNMTIESMEVASDTLQKVSFTFTYGYLEEDSVYDLLGITSDDLVLEK